MSQDTIVLPTTGTVSGLTMTQNINAALLSLVTNHSGASAPSTTYAYMLWADTANALLKQRNAANSAWVTIGELAVGIAKGTDITAAATTDIGAATGDIVDVTHAAGTVAISALGTIFAGARRTVRFQVSGGTLTLTHNATSLILPGGADITVADDDVAEFASLGSGNWYCKTYTRANGSTIRSLTSGTAIATTSGTSHDFTDIPSWVKRITISLSGVSTNGTSIPIIQIGDSGGIETTNYLGAGWNAASGAAPTVTNHTVGFNLVGSTAATCIYHGAAVLTLVDAATNTWAFASSTARSETTSSQGAAGSKALSGTLTTVRLTTVNGTDTFDAGSVNILYE